MNNEIDLEERLKTDVCELRTMKIQQNINMYFHLLKEHHLSENQVYRNMRRYFHYKYKLEENQFKSYYDKIPEQLELKL